MVVVLATTFDFGIISFAGAGLQIVILVFGVFMLLKAKNEFEISFVKSFITNLFLLFIGAVGVGAKSLDTMSSGSFITTTIFALSTVIFYLITYIKSIKRSKKYILLEGLTINSLVSGFLAITIFQQMGVLNVSSEVDLQTIVTGACLVPLFINAIMSTVDWNRALNFKRKEKSWD